MAYSDGLPPDEQATNLLEWDAEISKNICTALAAGDTLKVACGLAGVHLDTVMGWLRRGNDPEDDHPTYKRFVQDVRMAYAKAEGLMVKTVRDAAKRDWKAAAWWLERRASEDWGPKKDSSSAEGQPITVKLQFPSPPPLPANQPTLPTGEIIDIDDAEIVEP